MEQETKRTEKPGEEVVSETQPNEERRAYPRRPWREMDEDEKDRWRKRPTPCIERRSTLFEHHFLIEIEILEISQNYFYSTNG